MNIGLLFFRHSDRVKKFIKAWYGLLESDDKIWDQDAFNKLAYCNGSIAEDDKIDRIAWGFNQTVTFGVLPVASFASGHTYFVQRMYKTQAVTPYVVHTTYQFGGSAGKRHRLREAGLWQDATEYYSQGQFLEVSITIPTTPPNFDSLGGREMTKYHLEAVVAQLSEIKDALAIAAVLNRTLIMPKIYCFCDRYWGILENCRPPGSANFEIPFVCPLDHVMIPDQINADLGGDGDELTMGGIDFREYSFLENPNVPETLKDGVVEVDADFNLVKDDDAENSSQSNDDLSSGEESKAFGGGAGGGGARERVDDEGKVRLVVPVKNTDIQLKRLFGSGSNGSTTKYKTVPLLRLKGSPSLFFSNFENELDNRRFLSRFRRALDIWCCYKTPEESNDAVHYFSNDFPLENDFGFAVAGQGIVIV
jgi:hypothetical protein